MNFCLVLHAVDPCDRAPLLPRAARTSFSCTALCRLHTHTHATFSLCTLCMLSGIYVNVQRLARVAQTHECMCTNNSLVHVRARTSSARARATTHARPAPRARARHFICVRVLTPPPRLLAAMAMPKARPLAASRGGTIFMRPIFVVLRFLDVKGFDSSIILTSRGGIFRPVRNFPESLSQAVKQSSQG